MNLLLDTNVVLYMLDGILAEPLPRAPAAVSIITRLELLSFPGITPQEEESVLSFLKDVETIGLTPVIEDTCIQLRKKYRLRLSDAIIGATALAKGMHLLSNDKAFQRVSEVTTSTVRIKSLST